MSYGPPFVIRGTNRPSLSKTVYIGFDKTHRYQFLLYYLLRYIMRRLKQSQSFSKLKELLYPQILGKTILTIVQDPSFQPFLRHTIYGVDEKLRTVYTAYIKENKPFTVSRREDQPFRYLDFKPPPDFDVDAFCQIIKTARLPVTDLYVLAGLHHIKTGGNFTPEDWEQAMNTVYLYCDHSPDAVSVIDQIALVERYQDYEWRREQHGRLTLGILRREYGWKLRSTEEKELFLLQRFFTRVEEMKRDYDFDRHDFLTYVLRILRRNLNQ